MRFIERISTLGEGSSAIVSLAKIKCEKDDGSDAMEVAMKSARKPEFSWIIERECSILGELQGCPQIIKLIGSETIIEDGKKSTYSMYLEKAPHGSLFDLIKLCGALSQQRVRDYTWSMLKGLAHIHHKTFVHCDIKPANLLVWSELKIKIVDFGLAIHMGTKNKRRGAYDIRGTARYIAPESWTCKEYKASLDIWSLGCVVVEMLTGKPALKFDSQGDVLILLDAIQSGDATPEIPQELCEVGKDFLRKCFVREPELRWSATMLLNHPFAVYKVEDPRNLHTGGCPVEQVDMAYKPIVRGKRLNRVLEKLSCLRIF